MGFSKLQGAASSAPTNAETSGKLEGGDNPYLFSYSYIIAHSGELLFASRIGLSC
jgi:hypothetical protein